MSARRDPMAGWWESLPKHVQEVVYDLVVRGVTRTEELKAATADGYLTFIPGDVKVPGLRPSSVAVKTRYDAHGRVESTRDYTAGEWDREERAERERAEG